MRWRRGLNIVGGGAISEMVIWTNTWRTWRSKELGERKESSDAHIFELWKIILFNIKTFKFAKWSEFHFYYLSISQSVKHYFGKKNLEMKTFQVSFFKEDILHHKGIWRSKLIGSMCSKQIPFLKGKNFDLKNTLNHLRVVLSQQDTKLNVDEFSHWKWVKNVEKNKMACIELLLKFMTKWW